MIQEDRASSPVTEKEAVRLAREIYGLEAAARALPGEYDHNFHLTGAGPDGLGTSGAGTVLKVMHPARERGVVELQCAALQHLARRAPQLALPRVVTARSGEAVTLAPLADGTRRMVWMLTYVPGKVLAEAKPHTEELLESLGGLLGELSAGLADFAHPAAKREWKWDLERAGWIREKLGHIGDAGRRELVEKILARYEGEIAPLLPGLRHSVIYGDANDYNVIVGPAWPLPRRAVSVIDYGDMHHSVTVGELAVAVAYAILGKKNLLGAAAAVVRGFHRSIALREEELAALFGLVCTRLAVSVVNSAHRKTLKPDDTYVTISEAPAWEALERLAGIAPRFAEAVFREACGFSPDARAEKLSRWLAANGANAASVLDADLRTVPCKVFDLSAGSLLPGADPQASETASLTEKIFGEMKRCGAVVGVGRYDEARLLYSSPLFGASANPTDERRTIHLGMDLFVPAGTAVNAPLDGVVHALANRAAAQDYGPMVLLRHEDGDGEEFFTLYGHLSAESVEGLRAGQELSRGERFARVGGEGENGGWAPHLHFQVIADLLDLGADFPGVARASERGAWKAFSPDPNLLLGIPAKYFPKKETEAGETLEARRGLLGKNLSISYGHPLKIVRGWKQYLYDDTGRAFLDVYNNVPLVGHSHPRVVRAAQEQLALLNTNTRYLHDNVVRYARRLTERMPAPLRVCYFLNSGSEANELAIRMARAHTRREDVIVLEHAYHGHTNTLIDVSPYKFDGPGGGGKKPWVHVAPLADDYRGAHRRGDAQAGAKYARHVAEIFSRLHAEGRSVAAYLAETLPSVGGQIVFPPGYLAEAYRHVRAAGAVCIADEVQVGFGRLGTHFWGFETQGVVPDIVVLGKPIGNAFPLAAVVTTAEIAASFANGMEFFSTFGGNPVACAAGLAVLDVLEEERLQENALRVGKHFITGLKRLEAKQELIGDVRGSGLFLGVDLVRNRETREAATEQAGYVVNRLRERGILAGTDGPQHNVLKLRPPLVFTDADADLFVDTLDEILGEDAAQART
ncbi:MAG: aminotransferase class III-fold pyridoxal phosphate-dependent enzyme [Acidobacteriia bacterium]|nr:aminotransferase class III-fold pyridoxal phosphate-dependent enzyme [Terriglobia bacterium]